MKFSSGLAVASGLATLAAAQSDIQCQEGIHIIVARASEEQPGFGVLGAVKDQVLDQIANSDAVAVPYPAVIQGPDITYPQSVMQGDGNMTSLVTSYGDACPDGKMVLMGYSQGAQVVADTLIGQDYAKFPVFGNNSGLDEKYIKNVAAVIMMGDPSHVVGAPVNFGNATRDGFFPRSNSDLWDSTGLTDRTRSYCDAEDFYCDSGKAANSHQIHAGYVAEYGKQAVEFVVKAVTGSDSTSGSGSGSGPVSASTGSQFAAPTPSTGGPAVPTTVGPQATSTGASGNGAASPSTTGASNTATPPASGTGAAPAGTSTGAAAALGAGSMAYALTGLVGFGVLFGM